MYTIKGANEENCGGNESDACRLRCAKSGFLAANGLKVVLHLDRIVRRRARCHESPIRGRIRVAADDGNDRVFQRWFERIWILLKRRIAAVGFGDRILIADGREIADDVQA
jgi:hypothetical protein